MSNLKEMLASIRDYVKAGINTEMPVEQMNKANEVLAHIDNVEKESEATAKELSDCKEFIVKSVREGGSKNLPADDSKGDGGQAKTLEEIAQEIVNK